MRRMLFYVAVILLFPLTFFAQVSGYSYASASGTYSAITGGTVLGDASTDDQRFVDPASPLGGTTTAGPGFPIGFNFNYGGTIYNKVGVNANGWITLGSSSINVPGTTTGLSSTSNSYVMAPFGRDLQSQTGGEIRIQTLGTTPNQQLVVQWTNYKRYGTTGTGDVLNFQVILNEADNSIQFVYGSCSTTSTSTSGNVQVGIKGASISDHLNFDGTFAALTLGASTSADVDFNNTSGPSNGQTITFTPPSCFAPSALGATNKTTTSASVYWTTGGASNWNVEYGISGFSKGSGTMVNATNDTLSLTGLSANTSYDFYVRDSCGVGNSSLWAGPFTFRTAATNLVLPYYNDFETTITDFYNDPANSNNWVIDTAKSSGTSSVKNAYSASAKNRLILPNPINLATYPNAVLTFDQIAKTEGTYDKCYVEYSTDGGTTWIKIPAANYSGASLDYATRLYFHEDSYTQWGTGTQTPTNAWWKTESFSLAGLSSGSIMIRFNLEADASGQRAGWYIDNLSIINPSCAAPTLPGVVSVTPNTATIYWTTGGATNWNVEYGPQGFTPGSGTVIAATNDTLTLTGLTQLSAYDFYVQDDCGAINSSWTGPTPFMTTCASALSGTYTIDGSISTGGTNYATFGELVSALSNCGVSGAVTVNVKEGTYNEQISFDSIAGASAANPIVIQADAANTNPVILTYAATGSSDNFVVLFDNSDYITISGLTITATGSSYSRVIQMDGSCTYLTIDGNILNGTVASSTSTNYAVVYNSSGSTNKINNCQLINNQINDGSYGVYWYGSSSTDFELDNIISGNTISGFYYYGISFEYQDGGTLDSNSLNSSNSYTTVYGISNYYSDNSTVTRNKIVVNGTSTNYGIYNYYNDATPGAPNLIANNMVSCIGNSGSTYGIYAYNNYYTDIYYNSVNVTGGSTTAGRALYLNSSTTGTYGFVNIKNNNLVNSGGGYAVEVSSGAVTLGYVTASDYNNAYATGATLIRFNNSNYADLATYQAAVPADVNSVSAAPLFAGSTDLHVSSPILNDAATPIAGITADIDGDLRSGTTPDIGADEFTPPSCLPSSGLTVSAIYSDSAIVSWTAGTGTTFNLEYGPTGFTIGTGTTITGIVDTFYTITGLSALTTYDFYVQDNCGASGTAPMSGPGMFTTACASVSVFPWLEDFETSANSIPSCWENETNDNADWIFRSGSIGHGATVDHTLGTSSGHYAGMDDSQSSANDTVNNLLTPFFDLTGLTAPRLNFWYFIGNDATLTSKVKIDVYDGAVWHMNISTVTYSQTAWLEHSVDLTPYKSAVTQIRFRGVETTDFNSDVSLDDIKVEEAPSCIAPSLLGVTNINDTTVDAYWTSTSGASSFIIEYGATGFTPGSGTTLVVTNDTSAINGLTASTSYDYYVADICAVGDTSAWVGPFSFTTALCNSVNACSYALTLNDFYGDGWNGTEVTIYQNNVAVAVIGADFTSLTGNPPGDTLNMNMSLCDNASTYFVITNANTLTYPEEIGIDVRSPYGILVGSYDNNASAAQGDTILSFTASCAVPSCLPPTLLGAYNISDTSATLYFTSGGAANFNLQYGVSGFTLGSGTTLMLTNDTVTINGLTSNTNYEFYVQDSCGLGNSSVWMGPLSFRTLITGPRTLSCTSGAGSTIFSEEFDNSTSFTGDINAGNGSWLFASGYTSSSQTGPSGPHSGSYYIYTETSTGGPDTITMVSPAIDLSTVSSVAELSFWLHAYGATIGVLNVGVSTSATGPFTTAFSYGPGELQTSETDPFQNVGVNLDSYVGQIIYLQFEYIRGSSYTGDLAIDLLEVKGCVSCPAPTALGAYGISDSSATVFFTTGGSSNWNIQFDTTGFALGTGTMMSVTNDTVILNGLMSNTTYQFYVQDSCAVGDVSIWAGPYSFTTACSIVSLPYVETFEPSSPTLGCVSAQANWTLASAGGYALSATSLEFPFYSVSSGTYSAFSPQFAATPANYQLSFDHAKAAYTTEADSIKIYYSMDGGSTYTLLVGLDGSSSGALTTVGATTSAFTPSSATDWSTFSMSLPVGVNKIRIDAVTDYGNNLYIDNFSVAPVPVCSPATNLTVLGKTTGSITVTWTSGSISQSSYVSYALAGSTGGQTIVTASTSDTITLAGLTPQTAYDICVYDICSTGDTSVALCIIDTTMNCATAGMDSSNTVCTAGGMVNLSTYLQGADAGGTWVDLDASGALSGSTLNPALAGTGTYHFGYVVSAPAPCGNDTAVISINIVSMASAGSNAADTVCENTSSVDLSTYLNGADPGGNWVDLDASGALSGATLNPSMAGSGTFDFAYVVSGGAPCPADTAMISINVEAAANAGNDATDTICDTLAPIDLTSYLGANFDAGGTWVDVSASGALTGSTFDPWAVQHSATYIFRYEVAGGNVCPGDSATISLYVDFCSISVKEFKRGSISVYPNPTDGLLYIDNLGNDGQKMKVEIYSLNGQLLLMNTYQGTERAELDLSHLAKGVYNVRVITDDTVEVHQISRN